MSFRNVVNAYDKNHNVVSFISLYDTESSGQ